METKPVVMQFPLCRKLGVISYPKGEPRVLDRDLKQALSQEEYRAWSRWYEGSTFDMLGIYAWDVEAFLAGQPNLD